MKSVSLIIPAYNSESCITQTLESCCTQLLPSDEVIVVDDGSSDDTARALGGFEHQSWFTLIRQENGGPSAARNTGIAQAKGHYLCFLDSDDFCLPGSIAIRRGVLEQNPNIDFVFADHFVHRIKGATSVRRHHENGFLASIANHVVATAGDLHILSCSSITPKYLANPCIHLNTLMVRRDFLQKSGGFNEGLRCAEDTDFVLRLFWKGNLAGYIDAPLSDYNRFTDGISSVSNRVIAEHIKFFFGILGHYDLDSAYVRKRLADKYLDLSLLHLECENMEEVGRCLRRAHDFVPFGLRFMRHWLKSRVVGTLQQARNVPL